MDAVDPFQPDVEVEKMTVTAEEEGVAKTLAGRSWDEVAFATMAFVPITSV